MPPEAVWPWLAQIGQDRGGFYSYEWLENLAGCRMRNADRIHPEWQDRQAGDTVLLHPSSGLKILRLDPGRAPRGVLIYRVLAKLKPGTSVAQAQAEMSASISASWPMMSHFRVTAAGARC